MGARNPTTKIKVEEDFSLDEIVDYSDKLPKINSRKTSKKELFGETELSSALKNTNFTNESPF